MKLGVGPGGVASLPGLSLYLYQRMKIEDLIDLKAYLDTLPAVANAVPPHELPFPFSFRRGLGLWQLLYVDGKTFVPDPDASEEVNRGAYLVKGARTLRRVPYPSGTSSAAPSTSLAYAGGPSPEGKGRIPNITPDKDTGIGSWSEDESSPCSRPASRHRSIRSAGR